MSISKLNQPVRTQSESATQCQLERKQSALIPLVLSLVAALGSIICSVIVGLGLGPLQARIVSGHALPTDQEQQAAYYLLLSSNILWAAIGITGLVLALIAFARGGDKKRSIVAITIALGAPFLSFFLWLLLTLLPWLS